MLAPGQAGAPVFPNVLSDVPAELLTSITSMDPGIDNGVSRQFGLQIERQLARGVSATIGYARIDRHGMIHEINDAGARMLGLPHPRTVRQSLTASVVPEDRPLLRAFLRQLRHAIAPLHEEELTVAAPGGGAVRLHLEGHCLSDGGDQTCWIALTDVTEQQRLAEERHRAHLERQRAEVERARARSRSEAQNTFFAATSTGVSGVRSS